MVFPKIGGTPPKWMVKITENPIKMDDLGGKTRLFLETSISTFFKNDVSLGLYGIFVQHVWIQHVWIYIYIYVLAIHIFVSSIQHESMCLCGSPARCEVFASGCRENPRGELEVIGPNELESWESSRKDTVMLPPEEETKQVHNK